MHDDAPTPQVRKPTVELWPMYSRLAREVARECDEAARDRARAAEQAGSFELGSVVFETVPALRALTKDATAIAETFEAWEHADPGGDLRRLAIAKLMDLRERARELNVEPVRM